MGSSAPKIAVKQTADGIWYTRLYLGIRADGKAIRPYRQFSEAATEEEAQELADAWASSLTAAGAVRSMLLPDLLADYIAARERGGCSPNSARQYRLFTKYAKRYLGSKDARDLSAMDFYRFEQRLLTPKGAGGQGLCRNSVRNVHDFLRGAYGFFVKVGICAKNPLIDVAKPKLEKHEARSLDVAELPAVENAVTDLIANAPETDAGYRTAMHAFAAWLSLKTGMRCGEACAVRRCDVNSAMGHVHVGGTVVEQPGRAPYRRAATKGRKCRNVAVTGQDLRFIGHVMDMQARRLGDAAITPRSPLVLPGKGGYMRPSAASRAFTAIAHQAGCPKGTTFHALRHTHATWLLQNGVDLKTVSERLGHADEATTLRLYAHVLPGRDAQAAGVFERAVKASGGAKKALGKGL